MNDIETEYPTFNGLNRQAMIFGVPLIPFMACFFVLMMLFMVAMTFLGGKSLFILLLVIPIFLALRSISANDDQAFKIYGFRNQMVFVPTTHRTVQRRNHHCFHQIRETTQ